MNKLLKIKNEYDSLMINKMEDNVIIDKLVIDNRVFKEEIIELSKYVKKDDGGIESEDYKEINKLIDLV